MPARNQYVDFLVEWLSPLGEITARRMFGGHTLYCNGVVFALVADRTLYLKADELTRPRFEAKGLEPFRPFEDRPEVMQYYPPPAEFFEDPDVMRDWGQAALEVGKRGQATRTAGPQRGRAGKRAAPVRGR